MNVPISFVFCMLVWLVVGSVIFAATDAVINLIKMSIKVYFEETKSKWKIEFDMNIWWIQWNKFHFKAIIIFGMWALCSSCGAGLFHFWFFFFKCKMVYHIDDAIHFYQPFFFPRKYLNYFIFAYVVYFIK